MLAFKQYISAQSLEQYLGDPADAENPFSFKRAIELDEMDAYPVEACERLNDWKFHHYYVPREEGGRLEDFEELLSLLRVVAHRDLTVAWAHGMNSILGAVNVWVGGHDGQKRRLAQLLKRGEQVAIAYHEKEHGSDMLAVELEATRESRGYLLTGEKWVIGNATRSTAMTVFARTDPRGGPRGFSLFFVEKTSLPEGSYTYLPRLKTHGIRGAEISGISFKQCLIPQDSLIGALGQGLELTLKSFQLTRTLFTALSLGAADRALRTTTGFALSRQLYGGYVFDIPHARLTLVNAFLDLLICDCMAISAARALHVSTDQMSVWSAVAKYFVPTTVEKIIASLAVVLGARYYLREDYCFGIFQKLLRDSAVVSLGHAGSFTNLQTIAQHLPSLSDGHSRADQHGCEELRLRLRATYSLGEPLPAFAPGKLEIVMRGCDDVLRGAELLPDQLSDVPPGSGLEPQLGESLQALAVKLQEQIEALKRRCAVLVHNHGAAYTSSPEAFDLAKRYCTLHAATTCLHIWLHNRHDLGEFFAKGAWLVLCLDRLLSSPGWGPVPAQGQYVEAVAEQLSRLHNEDMLFSVVPFQTVDAAHVRGSLIAR
jgi:alkylation response protein AidB-like acyl-CoA dehydrogenase